MAVTSCSLAGGSRGHRRDWKCTQREGKKSPWHCWIPTLPPKQSRARRDPGTHTSHLSSCRWPGVFSSLPSLLPLTLHVPAKEQQCAPCRAPGSSEISSSDDKTYLKTLNPRKIKAMTRCYLQNSISFVKKVLIANMWHQQSAFHPCISKPFM